MCPGRRITPAYAGKSGSWYAVNVMVKDHPRIRGEKLTVYRIYGTVAGSPPHTRGKVLEMQNENAKIGITPAYAGKRLRKPRKIKACCKALQRFSFSFSKII